MFAFVEVLRGVFILGRVAATDIPALKTKPKMHPPVARFNALFADVLVGFRDFDLVEMRTFTAHWTLLIGIEVCKA
jgi:hypothetical protein